MAGLDDESDPLIDIVVHRRVVRGNHRFGAGHEFHQRQAQTFAARSVDVETRGTVKPGELLVVQIAVHDHHPTGKRRELREQGDQVNVVARQVVLGDFQHQRGVFVVTHGPAEGGDQVMPVLATVGGIEHADIDHATDVDLYLLVGVGQRRLRMGVRLHRLAHGGGHRQGCCWRGRRAQFGQLLADGARHHIAHGFAIPHQQVVLE